MYPPWNRKRPTILEARPKEPTNTTRRGLEISGGKGQIVRILNERLYRSHTGSTEEPFNGFEEYGETKREKENAVDESGKDFSTMPTIGVTSVEVGLICELTRKSRSATGY